MEEGTTSTLGALKVISWLECAPSDLLSAIVLSIPHKGPLEMLLQVYSCPSLAGLTKSQDTFFFLFLSQD